MEQHNFLSNIQYERRKRQQMLEALGQTSIQIDQAKETADTSKADTADAADTEQQQQQVPKIDPRVYQCDTWLVTPNIRFLDKVKWDPPGVDMLLQRLGRWIGQHTDAAHWCHPFRDGNMKLNET